jgi:signal transduction histidine kinase
MSWLRPSVRLRLTLLYGGLFIAASVLLLALTYGLLGQALQPLDPSDPDDVKFVSGDQEGEHEGDFEEQLFTARNEERAEALSAVLTQSLMALLVTAAGAIVLGWVVAGRVLRPIRQITAHARHASEATLGERIELRGPPDELQELGDTIDAMLGRLEAAFAAQRWFAAQASHELRTPLAVIHAEADVALAAPDATDRERRLGEAVRTAAERSERLVDGLLALSRSESTLRDNAPLDLAELVGDVVGEQARAADAAGLVLDLALETAPVTGDRMLLERLVGNLVENAIRYNYRGGWVRVSVARHAGNAVLRVANSGPVMAPSAVTALFEPFQRGRSDRPGRPRGFGLGLAIVRSVATAHDGEVAATSPAEGGLVVTVRLPEAGPPPASPV